jgi:6-phosphogluconolactonase
MWPHFQLVIGTYTESLPHVDGQARGVLGAHFNAETGSLDHVRLLADARNPSFAALSVTHNRLYVVNETRCFSGRAGGGVTAFARDPKTGGLTQLNSFRLSGTEPCHLCVDESRDFVVVANYGSGSVSVLGIEDDGRLGRELIHVRHAGSGVHPVRQTAPHAHMVCLDPCTERVMVSDLGIDSVLIYDFTRIGGFGERRSDRVEVAAGTGPRHLAFHPDAQHCFVVGELNGSVCTLRRTGSRFEMTHRYALAAPTRPSAIAVSPSGRHVLVCDRGDDSVVMLAFDRVSASLTPVASESSGGGEPRDLCFAPGGRFVVVANQSGGNLAVLAVDEDSPTISLQSLCAAPTPVCVLVAR